MLLYSMIYLREVGHDFKKFGMGYKHDTIICAAPVYI